MESKNLSKIIEKTSNLFKSNSIPDNLMKSTRINGFWGILSCNLNNQYSYNEASRLRMAYLRNSFNYKTLVEKCLASKSSNVKEELFQFSNLEWAKHLSENLSKKQNRREFLINFHDELSHNLQIRGNKQTYI